MLEQESSLITEMFMRQVRNGAFVCAGSATTPPSADTDNVANLTIRAADSSVAHTFGISGDSLTMDGNKYLTAYLCKYKSPVSHFKIFQNGNTVQLYLSMFLLNGTDSILYTQTIGDVRCKN